LLTYFPDLWNLQYIISTYVFLNFKNYSTYLQRIDFVAQNAKLIKDNNFIFLNA